jgi:hypothetical protein
MGKEAFEEIIAEFPAEFDSLKGLAEELNRGQEADDCFSAGLAKVIACLQDSKLRDKYIVLRTLVDILRMARRTNDATAAAAVVFAPIGKMKAFLEKCKLARGSISPGRRDSSIGGGPSGTMCP